MRDEALDYGLDCPGSIPGGVRGVEILFNSMSRLTLGLLSLL